MSNNPRIGSPEELLAYANKIERAAAIRYGELAEQMEVHNNAELAAFLREMSRVEWEHVNDVDKLSDRLEIEGNPAVERFSDLTGGEAPDYMDMHYMQQPYHVISLALEFERSNAAFYASVAAESDNDKLKEFASRLQEEEESHVAELEKWLGRYPEPDADWDEDLDPPVSQE